MTLVLKVILVIKLSKLRKVAFSYLKNTAYCTNTSFGLSATAGLLIFCSVLYYTVQYSLEHTLEHAVTYLCLYFSLRYVTSCYVLFCLHSCKH